MKEAFIKIHPEDAVAVATQDTAKGTEVSIDGARILLRQDIPVGHKVALRDMASGEAVIKYGTVIGHATQPIHVGDWVHMHNMDTNLSGQLSYTYNPHPHEASPRIAGRGNCFQGYRRADGRVGTRNELWIIPTVSCVNTTIRLIQEEAQRRFPERCDGIFAFPHNAGCSQMGEDFQNTQNILKSIIQHPNAGGVLIVSLGCENNDFGLVAAALFLVAKQLMIHSKVGRAWIAIRENPHAANGMGINVTKYKVMAFAVSAFYTGFAGAMYAHLVGYIGPDTFTQKQSVMFVTMMLFGGTGSLLGPILGAVTVFVMTECLRVFEQYQMLIYGALLLVVIVAFPGGIYGEGKKLIARLTKRKGGVKNAAGN